MSTTRRVFPEVFKREAVDPVISSGLPVGVAAGYPKALWLQSNRPPNGWKPRGR